MSFGLKILLFIAAAILLLCLMAQMQPQKGRDNTAATIPQTSDSTYAVTGKPSITGQFIDSILCTWQSPGCGKGGELHDLGTQYGIDPAYALAFYMNESTFGTKGMARLTLALGNERCIQDRPCINILGGACQAGQSCYAKFYSLEDGFEHWYLLIRDGYVRGQINKYIGRNACPCATVAQIIPVYAPAADDNNEQHYIYVVEHAVDLWRAGKVALA